MNDPQPPDEPYAHLKRRAIERANRTVERTRAGLAALRATGRKITTESLKQMTRDLETGFPGLSFQVIRRNARAYALCWEAADAFRAGPRSETRQRRRGQRRTRASARGSSSSYDPMQRLDKRALVQ